jgi:hypothetical protein
MQDNRHEAEFETELSSPDQGANRYNIANSGFK